MRRSSGSGDPARRREFVLVPRHRSRRSENEYRLRMTSKSTSTKMHMDARAIWHLAFAACAVLAFAGIAAEQKPTQPFEAVSAPQIELKQPDLEQAAPPGPAAPATEGPASAVSQPVWWGDLQRGLDQELDPSGAAGTQEAGAAPASQPEAGDSPWRSTSVSMAKAVAATCVVVALILVCYYVAGRFGKKNPLFAASSLGRILGRVHLSPRAELFFVRVKDRVLVVGVTATEISRVAEFDAALFDDAPQAVASANARAVEHASLPAQQPSAFAQELRAQTSPEPTTTAVTAELAALKAELDKARQYFRETSGDPGAL
ncbi:MAG: FliO/MopB family protein [Candidatus Hydrogenedentes bacterium]|nr:FliO/MopB family protein [Candidatus Hydrogenedentota bacterium]